jgi:phosphate transport system permease protein
VSVTTTATTPPPSAVDLHGRRSGLSDRAFRYLTVLCGLFVLAVLVLIAVSMTREAWPAFRDQGITFFAGTRWAPGATPPLFGSLPFVYGTLVVSAIALVMAVPVSVGIALFLSEMTPRRLRRPASSLVDLLAAIPSVVYGLWGILVFGPVIVKAYEVVSDLTRSVPVLSQLFGGPPQQKSLFTAGIILGLMITPIITSITREVFDTVPAAQKEAAFALGATRWEMIRAAILPHSRAGVIGAVMLGLGRAMGETIAAALVIGSVPQISAHLFGSGDAMAAVIANQFGEAGGLHRAALIALGVELFALTIVVNMVARAVVARGFPR